MKRTRLCDRALPDYTVGEERMNMITHIVGGALGVAALVLCVLIAASHHHVWGIVSGAIYGASFIILYTMSSIYHGLRPGTAKQVMRVLDHCTIFLLIAGTYTPISLCAIRRVSPAWGWALFGLVWGCAVIGVVFTAIDLKKYAVLSMVCYIGMGWCIVLAIRPAVRAIPLPGLLLLLAGGVVYTVGAALYRLGKTRRYIHSVFHLFVLAGSVLQFFCIFLYIL